MQGLKDRLQQLQRDAGGQLVLVWVGFVAFAAILVAALLTLFGYGYVNTWAVAALALLAAVADRGHVELSTRVKVSISLLPTLFAAVLFGPLAAMTVFASALLLRNDIPPLGRVSFMATRALTGAATGLAATESTRLVSSSIGQTFVAASVGAVTAEILDVSFASITYRLRGHGGALKAVRELVPVAVASIPFYAPVVAVLTLTYREISPWTLPLFFVPALAAQRWFILYQEQRRLAEDLSVANRRLESANLSFAGALVATLDARDRYTAGHSAAVAIYARDIAARMGLSAEDQNRVHLAGLVHDIGKIGLPPGLLEKPGALSLDERRQMEKHSAIGERILAKVDDYAEIASVVRHHHERVDGHGYPDGRGGREIPLLSRIIAVADAYNAMTSDRPYRDAMPSRVARLRLAQAVGTQFDTSVVAAFEAILATASEAYRLGITDDFQLRTRELAPMESAPAVAVVA
jgi:putative nucleotidyltransferase with HDIG domain